MEDEMVNIELPKDADGREIPLDTIALYDDDGNVHSVRRFIYTPDFDLGDKWKRSWIAVVDNYKTAKPEQMYLTQPDSWEKLLEDLDRVVENKDAFYSTACAYMNQGGATCNDCMLHSHNTRSCTDEMFKDVVSRIRKLRGDDE